MIQSTGIRHKPFGGSVKLGNSGKHGFTRLSLAALIKVSGPDVIIGRKQEVILGSGLSEAQTVQVCN